MNEDNAAFHRRVAEDMAARYTASTWAPEGWRETMAWHWEQAGGFGEAADAALEVAEMRVTRLDFTAAFSDVLKEGAGKLTLADQNEEGANILTLQTRQQLGTISLSLANQAQQAILRLF